MKVFGLGSQAKRLGDFQKQFLNPLDSSGRRKQNLGFVLSKGSIQDKGDYVSQRVGGG